MDRRNHVWGTPCTVDTLYRYTTDDYDEYQGRAITKAGSEKDAILGGFVAFLATLKNNGVNVPKTIRRMDYGDHGGGTREDT